MLLDIPRLKDELRINVELASPADFIPVLPGWSERGPFVVREERLTFYHFELVAQALAKRERAHTQDLEDVKAMIARGLVESDSSIAYFEQIEPELHRFPAIDPRAFRRRVEETFAASS